MSPLKKEGLTVRLFFFFIIIFIFYFFSKSREHCHSVYGKYKAQHRDRKNYKALEGFS